ncbi:MAG: hypothetical protein ABIQ15_11925 [Nocardioides sp.]
MSRDTATRPSRTGAAHEHASAARPVGEAVAYLERGGLEVRDVRALREHYLLTVHAVPAVRPW